MDIRIENKDYLEFLATIPNESIDFVCIDPPYNVLTGHKIETKINIPLLTKEVNRILKPNSFYSIFGQMPTIVNWYIETMNLFEWEQDITWVKRHCTAAYLPIIRQKELIYIFAKGNAKFYDTKGKYEDVKLPLLLDGLLNIESLHTHISDLKRKIKDVNYNGKRNKKNRQINDLIYNNYSQDSVRSPNFANITNVWSFMPENLVSFGKNGNNHKHPTVKPIALLERLIKLCTPENAKVLDCFLGSGTTAIACKNTNRNFIGCELYEDYYQIALERLANTQPLLFHSV
jgi:site-specific DNA-methyltransferase (adenine-specific)